MANQIGKALSSSQIARPPNLDDAGWEWSSHRRSSEFYLWGAEDARPNAAGSSIGSYSGLQVGQGDIIRAYPQVFPISGTITSLGFWLVSSMVPVAAARFHVAIYDDDGNMYPAVRRYDSGSLASLPSSATGPNLLTPNLHVEANSVMWLAINANDAMWPNPDPGSSPLILWWDSAQTMAPLGYSPTATLAQMSSNNRYQFGWKISSLESNGMPSSFAAGATAIVRAATTDNTNLLHPCFGFKFTKD